MALVSRHLFLKTMFCPTLGWRVYNGTNREVYPPVSLFWMEQGKKIEALARELYPNGVFVQAADTLAAASLTRDLMKDPSVHTIFEGTFLTGNYTAKADIITRKNHSWELVEIRSTVHLKLNTIEDMAYTTLIGRRSGFVPGNICLQHINKEYRLGMPLEQLFRKVDCTNDVLVYTEQFESQLEVVESILNSPEEPCPKLTMNCKGCDFFDICMGSDVKEHILNIPRLGEKTFRELVSSGYISIHDIPAGFRLTPVQEKTVRCVQCGEVSIDPALAEHLAYVTWPAYYLDFETTQLVMPCYPDLRPYDSFPTQYSVHRCDCCGNIIGHRDYLAEPERDCRRELTKRLIRDLTGEGSIITYSSYEKNTITYLARLFPDLVDPLNSILKRIVDLEQSIKCIKHPKFKGKTSIKVVLPALVPDLSYNGLAINNGQNAMITYASMLMGLYTAEEMQQKRVELLEYCKLDTLAMVRLHEKLHEMIEK